MKIAVTYDNGDIFQHFGKTQTFRLYNVEDGKILSTELISSNGSGHGALAKILKEQDVDLLICGGIGGGAQEALGAVGIKVCAGAQGSADQAVEAYLRGELHDAGTTCHHHDHEEGHSCGDKGCGSSGCGHACGGCGSKPVMEGKNVGKTCKVHYRGTLNDGTQFDASYDRGEPLEFICGVGQMIPGFDRAVANMEVGQVLSVHLKPEEAYGEADPQAVLTAEIAQLPGSENLTVGQKVFLLDKAGQPLPVTVVAKDEKTITLDANHELAGKELNFQIELLEVR